MKTAELTTDQSRAVSARGSSILVSAAAGSGKTRVLTQRLMSYVAEGEEPIGIDRFLIITYTRAAAAELKGRILTELNERCAADPENRRLRRQATLCHNARIGTIHSFCAYILRENCHLLELSPDFRVGDEDRCAELKAKALRKVLDEAYEKMNELPGFEALVSTVGAGADDRRLEAALIDLHNKMQSHPYPEKWAQEQIQSSLAENVTDLSQTPWGRLLMDSALEAVAYWHDALDEKWRSVCADEEHTLPLITAYGDTIDNTLSSMRSLMRALGQSWDRVCEVLPVSFDRPGILKDKSLTELKDQVYSIREGAKKAMNGLMTVFSAPSEKQLSDLRGTAPTMASLLRLTLEFDRVYASMKRRKGLLDFSDLEHMAVRLLVDESTMTPTPAALALADRFHEIMVDEYQDVNAVQELIFNAVSRGGRNIFMVGDVKQSVYRFRLADPSIFIDKLDNYSDYSDNSTENRRVLLKQNFRSERGVIEGCNAIFGSLMSRSLGDVDYDGSAALVPRDSAAAGSGEVVFSLLSVPEAEEGETRPDKTSAEAEMVAADIKRLVESGRDILDGGLRRPVGYGDIAILLLSPGVSGKTYARALSDAGVPVAARQGGGFFTSPEIMVMYALLQIIDQPHRDVALTTVLTSPVFAFTPDELTRIRTADKSADFYTSLTKRAETDAKCADFTEKLGRLRALAPDVGVHELISEIFDALDVPAVFSAGNGVENLMLLSGLAADFESGGYRGLFPFLNYLDRLLERGEEPMETVSSDAGAVSIMSIHKSKGLEFPVVFLADTGHRFNLTDLRRPVLIHPELGLGCMVTNVERGIEYPTAARRAIDEKLTRETLSEEMRVLYVALTRAKELLYISCAVREPQAFLEKHAALPPHPEILRGMRSFADWLAVAVTHGAADSVSCVIRTENDAEAETGGGALAGQPATAEELAALHSRLSFVYPYAGSIGLPTKLTATSLPQQEPDLESQPIEPPRKRLFRKPRLSESDIALSGAEIGTATHIVMQYIAFAKTASVEAVRTEVARIASMGQLTPRQAEAVDVSAITAFFSSPLGRRLLSADRVYREMRFSLLCSAADFYPQAPEGEQIMLQGIVDCCIEEGGVLTVVDYKTDFVTEATLSTLTERYTPQLRAYAYAMTRVLKKPVASCLLCFLRGGLTSELPCPAL